MNSYYTTIGSADGYFSEIFVWARSLKDAENMVVFQCVTEYFKTNNIDPTNFYSKTKRKRGQQRSEFPITIYHNLFNIDDTKIFFITVRQCKDLKISSPPIIYS